MGNLSISRRCPHGVFLYCCILSGILLHTTTELVEPPIPIKAHRWNTTASSGNPKRGNAHRTITIHAKERTCSKKMGVITDQEPCQTLQIQLAKISGAVLMRELVGVDGGVDNNFLIRRIHIMTHDIDTLTINIALDVFLEHRPWWLIRKEVILGLERENKWLTDSTNASSLSVSGDGKHSAATSKFSHIYLHRYESKMEAHLHQIAAVQYPPQQECVHSRLKLSHTVNSGWGSASAFFGIFVTEFPWAIFAPYESNTNSAVEPVMYASVDLCPSVVNKWLCAFMPVTNCSFPNSVTKCGANGKPCKWDGDLMYTSASAEGKLIDESMIKSQAGILNSAKTALSSYHKSIAAWYSEHRGDSFIKEEPVVTREKKALGDRRANHFLVMKVFGQVWRPNAVYRTLISKRIKLMWREMFQKYQLQTLNEEESTCTAIHIRRGDRSLNMEGQAMRDWCNQWLPFASWDNCTSHTTGESQSCQGLSDYGCFSKNPFGALGLKDYLDAAWALQETRDVFVFTDDATWLERERKAVDQAWRIYSIASDGSKDRENNTPRATMNGVEFHASLKMAQTCQAFVGHWGSGVTHMVHNAMCYKHGNAVMGICPPTMDLRD